MISSFFEVPASIKAVVKNVETSNEGMVIVFDVVNATDDSAIEGWEFVQTGALTEAGIAVHKYGAYIIPTSALNTQPAIAVEYLGIGYGPGSPITAAYSEMTIGMSYTLEAD